MKAERGVALVLTTGILMLLAGIAAAMVGLASGLRVQAATATDRTAAGLLARSGIEYGSARLSQNPSPSNSPTPANQSDDCTFRDGPGIPLESALNPSYAWTEPYADLQANGKYDPGAEPYRDVNGNGRFDSWSGRLRGEYGMSGRTFSLKVAVEGGKISVNGGLTGFPFNNQLGTTCWKPPANKYMKSFDLPENGCIAELIDTLWEVLHPPDPDYNPYSTPPRQEPGEQMIRGRPLGGYRSLEEIPGRTAIPADQWEALKGYLTTQGGGLRQAVLQGYYVFGWGHAEEESEDSSTSVMARGCYQPYGDTGPDSALAGRHPVAWRRPVCLGSADRVVLQALFQGLASSSFSSRRSWSVSPSVMDASIAAGVGGTWIAPADAERLAGFFSNNRSFASWHDLYLGLNGNSGSIFPAALRQDRNLMADLVFANANPDNLEARIAIAISNYSVQDSYVWCFYPALGRRCIPPLSWVSYDLDRQADPVGPSRVERLPTKGQVWKVSRCHSAMGSGVPGASTTWNNFGTLELSLDDPGSAFSVESLGRIEAGRRLAASFHLSAEVQLDRFLSAHVQDEFENGGTARGWNLPPGASLEGSCGKRMTQTYPMFPLDSCQDLNPDLMDSADPPRSLDPAIRARYGVGSPVCGDIRLMHYASGDPRGAAFYAPMWEEGQPLRVPEHAAGWLENFRDIVGKADPEMFEVFWWTASAAAVGPRIDDLFPQKDLLESGATWKSYLRVDPIPPPDAWYQDVVNADSASLNGRRPVIPGSIFPQGRYTWNREIVPEARNAGDFPMVGQDGAVSSGTIEFWSGEQVARELNPLAITLTVSDTVQWEIVPYYGYTSEALVALGFISQPDWHHITVTFSSDSSGLYVDGILKASGGYEPGALDPYKLQAWESGYKDAGLQSEIRLYQTELGGAVVLAHASQSRFWNPASIGGNGEIPSYTSPLYRFDPPIELTHARWDGFVPKLVADAWSAGGPVPMSVELLVYDRPSPAPGESPRWIVPFPIEFWRSGGGGIDFKKMWAAAGHAVEGIPRIRALRYRVWMDVSAVNGFNNETPVFDSLEVRYANGAKITQWSGE